MKTSDESASPLTSERRGYSSIVGDIESKIQEKYE